MASNTASIRELLAEAERLETKDLGMLSVKVSEMLAKRPRPGLAKQEARLLMLINEGLPLELLERAAILHDKRQSDQISPEEIAELVLLTEKIEEIHLKRMKLVLKLAQMRGVPFKSLVDELGVKPFVGNGQ